MRALVVVAALACSGCATAHLVKHNVKDRIVVVAAPLCAACSEPYQAQRNNAMRIAKERCGSDVEIDEEGTELSGNAAVFVGGAGGGVMAEKQYYWITRCVD
jgi:hypothetical protein